MNFKFYEIRGTGSIPALLARIPAGEPLMLSDDLEAVDLNTLLTAGAPSPVILKVEGQSMCEEIPDQSWVIVSRDLQPEIGDIVVAELNGEMTLKRLEEDEWQGERRLRLVPSNGNMPAKEVKPHDSLRILAVVTQIIINAR